LPLIGRKNKRIQFTDKSIGKGKENQVADKYKGKGKENMCDVVGSGKNLCEIPI
jgi:hypothetical protein